MILSRKLRLYFQAHPIIVVTDQPLRQILHKPESLGGLIKWCMELNEFEIQYCPRNAIKGQALADFIADFTDIKEGPGIDVDLSVSDEREDVSTWILHMDSSSSAQGSVARVVIISPNGIEISYVLRFEFKASNNEAEYEALLAGLKVAKSLGAKNLEIMNDSQLIVHQVNDTYQAKEDNMIAFLKKRKELVRQFKKVMLWQIPREENFKADFLASLASLADASLPNTIVVKILPRSSIEVNIENV